MRSTGGRSCLDLKFVSSLAMFVLQDASDASNRLSLSIWKHRSSVRTFSYPTVPLEDITSFWDVARHSPGHFTLCYYTNWWFTHTIWLGMCKPSLQGQMDTNPNSPSLQIKMSSTCVARKLTHTKQPTHFAFYVTATVYSLQIVSRGSRPEGDKLTLTVRMLAL